MSNNRITRGARVFRDQVLAKFPDSHWNGHGEPDGFGVIRSLEFGGEAADYLGKVLPFLDDARISSHEPGEGDLYVVEFVPTRLADDVAMFQFDSAEVIADDAIKQAESEKPAPKKGAAAKKAAVKPDADDLDDQE